MRSALKNVRLYLKFKINLPNPYLIYEMGWDETVGVVMNVCEEPVLPPHYLSLSLLHVAGTASLQTFYHWPSGPPTSAVVCSNISGLDNTDSS